MSPTPQHGTPAGDATLAIQKLARKTGADVQELQTLYVLEALLARIAASEYRDDFVLKGGVLLAAFALRRPTKETRSGTGGGCAISRSGARVDLAASHIGGRRS